MEHNHYYRKSGNGGFWSAVGYLSFGLLGIMVGAALVYGLFVFFLAPEVTEPPVAEEQDEASPEEDINETEPGFQPEVTSCMIDIVEEIMPAVVGVSRQVVTTRSGEESLEPAESGSGVVISTDGHIVTNHHVVEGADNVSVLLHDKGRYDAEIIGEDILTDLALLKINETDLTSMDLGNSEEVMVGETVAAIGNPLGYFQQTVTAGIISAVERQVRFPGSDFAYSFIQTDALVNPGNSGGPLVNLDGEIIGINTAKISVMGVEGIGLAIPSNTVKRVTDDFLEYGRVVRPHLGVVIDDWPLFSEEEPDNGVLIIDIAPDSPAEEVGLQAGDVIVALDDREVQYTAQLFDRLLDYYPDDRIVVSFYRDGERNEVEVVLGERPEEWEAEMDPENFDFYEPEEE
ncbi:MAG: S1C family serine protease [Bacillota bacterium]